MELEGYKSFVTQLQRDAAEEIFEVGGYWPVPVALSVIGEELGAATGQILQNNIQEAPDFLMNATWILGCIANQYCCDLNKAKVSRWSQAVVGMADFDLRSTILLAFTSFGRITRIANRYESGTFTDFAENSSISDEIEITQWALLKAIELCGADVSALYDHRKALVRSFRGDPKHKPGHRSDPSYGDSLERFRALANITMCPFAKTAKVWAVGPWRGGTEAKEFVQSIRETIDRFVRVCQPEGFDGLTIEAKGIISLEGLKFRTNELLRALGNFSDRHPMSNPIERKEWRFHINGVDMFVTIFSSIYDHGHPRYSHSKNSTFFFIQPQISFKAKAAREKEKIRTLFAENGQDYRGLLKKVKFEAEKYIKPENLDEDSPIRWW